MGEYVGSLLGGKVKVDTSAVDQAAAKLDALSQHNPAVDVSVNDGAIDAAIQKALHLRAILNDVGSAALHAASQIDTSSLLSPSLGSTLMGNLTGPFVNGE